jgi:hypothetical protein
MRRISGLALLALPLLAAAAPAPKAPVPVADPELTAIAAEVREDRLRATIERLVAFGTRHTLSDRKSDARGIGAAERWTAAQFQEMSKACGGCLEVQVPKETFTGRRVPNPTEIGAILAIQKGTTDPDRVIVISGHIDSRVTDPMNATSDAPGANDDGSGTAAVIEAARVLSKHRFPATIVYAVLEGEEQGLYGGKVLANYAKAHGWKVEADLNNDIVGRGRPHPSPGLLRRHQERRDPGTGQPAPLQWRRGRQSVAKPGPLHRPPGGHLCEGPRRGHGLSHRPVRPRRRPVGDAGRRLPRDPGHRGRGAL